VAFHVSESVDWALHMQCNAHVSKYVTLIAKFKVHITRTFRIWNRFIWIAKKHKHTQRFAVTKQVKLSIFI